MSDIRKFRPATDADLSWMLEQQREVAEFREMIFLRDGRIFDTTVKMVAEVDDDDVAPAVHPSVNFNFKCPICGAPHFWSSRGTYYCKGVCAYRGKNDRPSCGWAGPAEECFTVPKEVPGEF